MRRKQVGAHQTSSRNCIQDVWETQHNSAPLLPLQHSHKGKSKGQVTLPKGIDRPSMVRVCRMQLRKGLQIKMIAASALLGKLRFRKCDLPFCERIKAYQDYWSLLGTVVMENCWVPWLWQDGCIGHHFQEDGASSFWAAWQQTKLRWDLSVTFLPSVLSGLLSPFDPWASEKLGV